MRFLFLFTLLLSIAELTAQNSESDSVIIGGFKKTIYTLADDSLGGRATGSAFEPKVLKFIKTGFETLGLKPKIQLYEINRKDSTTLKTSNIYCFINNHKKKTVLIGAHYDHIGLGGSLSRSFVKNKIHNGADDNASGVAMLLALAKVLKQQKNAPFNYIIVAYSGHEIGLFGSAAFLEKYNKRKFRELSLVVNMDMVGRLEPSYRNILVSSSDSSLLKKMSKNAEKFNLVFKDSGFDRLKTLDTKWFLEKNITAVNFSTGVHEDYHKTSDDAGLINYTGMIDVFRFIENVILEMGD